MVILNNTRNKRFNLTINSLININEGKQMAHFAKINEENIVLTVVVIADSDTVNPAQNEDESVGQIYCENVLNWPRHLWIQTSYNTKANKHYTNNVLSEDQSKAFRGNNASIGDTWDAENEIFWPQKPYTSWVKDVSTASWVSPAGVKPDLTAEQAAAFSYYAWNESGQSWDLITS